MCNNVPALCISSSPTVSTYCFLSFPSPFSCLDTEKSKCFGTSRVSLGSDSPLSLYYYICISGWLIPTSLYSPSLRLKKQHTLLPGRPMFWNLLSPWCREIDNTVTSLLYLHLTALSLFPQYIHKAGIIHRVSPPSWRKLTLRLRLKFWFIWRIIKKWWGVRISLHNIVRLKSRRALVCLRGRTRDWSFH